MSYWFNFDHSTLGNFQTNFGIIEDRIIFDAPLESIGLRIWSTCIVYLFLLTLIDYSSDVRSTEILYH